MKTAAALTCALFLCSCARYGDFTLPVLEPAPGRITWTWEVRSDPVLPRREWGAWDSVDTLNPSVIRGGEGWLNLYSGYDGHTWHTGLARSTDGIVWTRDGKILSPAPGTWEGDYIAANGTALAGDRQFLYWYQASRVPKIGLASSVDTREWKRHGDPVLQSGPRGSWDERGVADPYVLRIGSEYFMYYLGQDRARRQRLGVARSDDGVKWQKLRSNPVLELGDYGAFDDTGLGEPAVWQEQGSYWMLYTGRDQKEFRRLGLARSQDGVHWSRVTTAAVLTGEQEWDSAVVCDPTVVPEGDAVRVWFGGGNRPEPAENLNGQIGYAVLKLRVEGKQ